MEDTSEALRVTDSKETTMLSAWKRTSEQSQCSCQERNARRECKKLRRECGREQHYVYRDHSPREGATICIAQERCCLDGAPRGELHDQVDAFKRDIDERKALGILAAANQEYRKAHCKLNKGCKGHHGARSSQEQLRIYTARNKH